MCGIAVMVPKSNFDRPQPKVLHDMLARLEHRGPDGAGAWVNDRIGLAMRRLAIVGGDSGEQPIWNEDHSVAVVCNGEIYNYQRVREQLEADGHRFSGESDVEVIVHLYEKYQTDCVHYLEGTYAFALWDELRHSVLVVRDRVGVKPIYFAETSEAFLFASEIGALLAHQDLSTDLGDIGLALYHTFRFVPGTYTVLDKIRKLPPGHLAVIQHGRLQLRSYWQPFVGSGGRIDTATDRNSETASRGAAGSLWRASIQRSKLLAQEIQHAQELLFDAVQSQVAPAVKASVLLSGGLDSTALLAMMQKATGQAQHTLTVGFERPRGFAERREYSELDQAQSVADAFHSHHQAELYSAAEVLERLPEIIRDLDEPVADPTAIPLWFVSKLAKEAGNRVVFSGEGLDELFNGYDVYRQVRWNQRLQWIPQAVRSQALDLLQRSGLPGQGALRRSLQPLWAWYQGIGGTFSQREQRNLFTDNPLLQRVLNIDAQEYVRTFLHARSQDSQLAQMTYFDVFAWLPENTLAKSDKISMAHSIELRVPFLDKRLLEYALALPDIVKLRGKTGKWIVRQAVKEFVPAEVLARRKAGFPVPISAWMFGEWKEFAQSTLFSPHAVTRDLYRPTEIVRLFKTEEKHRRRAARLLWSLLVFEIWFQHTKTQAQSNQHSRAGRFSIPVNG